MTNFERIMESPESLAKTIYQTIRNSDRCQCPAFTACNGSGEGCEEVLTKWLNQQEKSTVL